MVNSGRPSRGCKTCKSRRIRCDLTRPECQRCASSGRVCPGVPTDSDILFRNQISSRTSNTTTGKPRKPTEEPLGNDDDFMETQPPELEVDTGHSTLDITAPNKQSFVFVLPRPSSNLPQPFEDAALSFYFRYFVPHPGHENRMNPWSGALREVIPRVNTDSPIYQTTLAVAMAALSNYPALAKHRGAADRQYLAALKSTGNALRDPIKSKSDEILMSTVLMGLYELMSSSEGAVGSYQHHMDGAVALVRFRGKEQLKNRSSLRLFRAVRTHVVHECAQKCISLEDMGGTDFWLSDIPYPTTSLHDLYIYSVRIPALRKRSSLLFLPEHNLVLDKAEVLDLLTEARKVDAKLLDWLNNIPKGWIRETIPSCACRMEDEGDIDVWPGMMHQYESFFIAGLIGDYRGLRLYLQDVISRCLIWLKITDRNWGRTVLFDATIFTTRKLVDDICATVPYNLGIIPGHVVQTYGFQMRKAAEALGAFYLIKSLHAASIVQCIPENQRQWLKNKLRFIALEYGFHQAKFLSTWEPCIVPGEDTCVPGLLSIQIPQNWNK